jgi:HEPN domain-containing protein
MPEPEGGEEARYWFGLALEDLRVAEKTIADPDLVPRYAAGMAQQAAEKALKAIIAVGGDHAPRTHDLVALARRAGPTLTAAADDRQLQLLTDALGLSRYPDPSDTAYDRSEVELMVQVAGAVVVGVRADLKRAGVTV